MERTDSEWAELHRAYKRRFSAAKRQGIQFTPTTDEKEAHRRYGVRYAGTERGRAILRAGNRKYKQSAHGKAAGAAYNKSESKRAAGRRYARTPQGRLVARRAKAKWRGHLPPEHADVNSLVVAQGNKCAICETEFSQAEPACLDHCHHSGVVRGALCNHCNLGIGLFDEAPERLDSAARYLRRCRVVEELDLAARGLLPTAEPVAAE